MSYFKAKVHQIRFRFGALPQTPQGELRAAPPDPPAGVKVGYF